MVRLVVMAVLLVVLTACGIGLEPSKQLVQRALALKVEQTQQQLSQQLHSFERNQPPKYEINQVVITQREPLTILNLPAYHVQGTYNFTLKSQRQVNQRQNPFELYLQRQKEGKTWRLALPQSTGKDTAPTWRTYLVQ